MNTRNRQIIKAYERQIKKGLTITIITPGNALLGQAPKMVDILKEQLSIYQEMYGDRLVVMDSEYMGR